MADATLRPRRQVGFAVLRVNQKLVRHGKPAE
jgi:hypothetical protein